jgi:hypothetical protein
MALEHVGRTALEECLYEYQVGFFTHPEYEYGVGDKSSAAYIRFLEINDFLIDEGCEVNEKIYFEL